MTDHVETTLKALIFTASVPGDVNTAGRLLVDNDSTTDQMWLKYAAETNRDYTFTDSTGAGGLLYEAETRTAMGSTATAVGAAGASGGGSNVMRNTALTTTYQALMSTQATGGGANLAHVGEFNVWARIYVGATNTGTLSMFLRWSQGDLLTWTDNPVQTRTRYATAGTWQLVNLGFVTLTKPSQGAPRWAGRLMCKSSVDGDDIDVDIFPALFPSECSGELSSLVRATEPTNYIARDDFVNTSGALVGDAALLGGNWAGAGDTDDFTGGGVATRATVSDTGPRVDFINTAATQTAVAVQADIQVVSFTASVPDLGIVARYVDISNYLRCYLSFDGLHVDKLIAGASTTLATNAELQIANGGFATGAYYTLRIEVAATGQFRVWYAAQSATLELVAVGSDTALATGGTLDDGRSGLYDYRSSGSAASRMWDNIDVWAPDAFDAAVFAGQSVEIRRDVVEREDATGTYWTRRAPIGDYLRLPPAGAEGRTTRVIVMTSQTPPGTGPDSGIADLSGKLFARPRYL